MLIFFLLTLILSHTSKRWGDVVTPKFFLASKSILSKYAAIDPFPLVPIICIAGIFSQGWPSFCRAFLILDKPYLILYLSYLGDNNSKIFKSAFFKI